MKSHTKGRFSTSNTQLHLNLVSPTPEQIVQELSSEERGAVFTRREVVIFILDLVGYTPDKPLYQFRLLEPSCGRGDFLIPAVERLLESWKTENPKNPDAIYELRDAVRAVELDKESFLLTRQAIFALMKKHGIEEHHANDLVDSWLVHGNFLFEEFSHDFTHIIGNPPYVRQERIPDELLAEYRVRYTTMYDRADLYIPFIEHSLNQLKKQGALGFICADRWTKNKYGGPLREMISRRFHLEYYVDMFDKDAFHSNVSAYPAVFVIRRTNSGPTNIIHANNLDLNSISKTSKAFQNSAFPLTEALVNGSATDVVRGSDPWMFRSAEQVSLLQRLESEFPLIEEAGCKVGIGVATGADKVFIAQDEHLDVEPNRKLPLVTTKDIESGTVNWKGLAVLNPFNENGSLVDLALYPRFATYLEKHAVAIKGRNCAKKNPRNWYRTIDRIYPELAKKPKLLIPDIKSSSHVVYEPGQLYPHHNLYYITSNEWDLRVLQTVLNSSIANFFISMYSIKMRGGYLRFQAQYLRRIRLPKWESVPPPLRNKLKEAAESGDSAKSNHAVCKLYGLAPEEQAALASQGGQHGR